MTVSIVLGYAKECHILAVPIRNRRGHVEENPSWLSRINKKIQLLRADVARLTQYNLGIVINTIQRHIRRICCTYSMHTRLESNMQSTILMLDTLKQKLSALCSKRQKYMQSLDRKTQNNLFRKNEKAFYRKLGKNRNRNESSNSEDSPTTQQVSEFWSRIWCNEVKHNEEASWINSEQSNYESISQTQFNSITTDDLFTVLKRAHNWKAPGLDRIQNFWYKRFSAAHRILARLFTEAIRGRYLPNFMTVGQTFLLPKGKMSQDPAKYRPITCLSTMYKLLTACINDKIYEHCMANNILAREQKGCIRNTRGCKEQLVIDETILKQTIQTQRNLRAAYIDFCKAFDSVPHS